MRLPVDRNAVFVELLGNGGVYSVDFERMFSGSLGLRVGYAAWEGPLLTPFYSLDEGEEAYPDPGFTLSAGVSFGYRF